MASYPLSEMLSYRLDNSEQINQAINKTHLTLKEFAKLSKERNLHIHVVGIPSKAKVYRSFHEVSGFNLDKRSQEFTLNVILDDYSFDYQDSILNDITKKRDKVYFTSSLI